MSSSCRGTFELPNRLVECELPAPITLSEAAVRAGIVLNAHCGSAGSCGGCSVDLIAGRFADAEGREIALDGAGHRSLACKTQVLAGAFHVRVPRHSLVEAGEKVVMDFAHTPAFSIRPPVRREALKLTPPRLEDARGDLERIVDALAQRGYQGHIAASLYVTAQAAVLAGCGYEATVHLTADREGWHIIRIQPGQAASTMFGAAVDVGTTTVVVALVDLASGQIVDVASSYNQQIIRCDDVASRISYASSPAALAELQDLVVEATVNRLLRLLVGRHGAAAQDVLHMTVSGNTVMSHLFCGLNPTGIGGVPFAPVTNRPGPYRGRHLKLAMNAEGFVDISPSTSAYIGGDITSDVYVCGQQDTDEVTAMIDIGTNAEITVGNRDRLIGCAAPAGPAFEGHGLSCGMRAAVGAIDTLRLAGLTAAPEFTVIGKTKPSGVCGSGLIDFVAQGFRAGLLTMAGRFSPQALESCARIRRIPHEDRELLAYEIVPAEATDDGLAAITITERDIAALLQAKGVIFAALQIAMKHLGKGFGQIDRFYLAGGFARHIDLGNAIAMGLLPDIPHERYSFVGNGSLAGAFLCLVDEQVRQQLPHVAALPQVVELNLDPEFMDSYTMAMFIPHADASLFPSVGF